MPLDKSFTLPWLVGYACFVKRVPWVKIETKTLSLKKSCLFSTSYGATLLTLTSTSSYSEMSLQNASTTLSITRLSQASSILAKLWNLKNTPSTTRLA